MRGTAAIVTVGSELLDGLRLDTNTAEVARALTPRGWRVSETVSVRDDTDAISAAISRLTRAHGLVVVTGGLGPTHDDVTREGASDGVGVPLVSDPGMEALLRPWALRHGEDAGAAVMAQALVLQGSEIIEPTTGTAPGMVLDLPASGSLLVLLPGPPTEMRGMLDAVLGRWALDSAPPRELGVTGMPEADAQLKASAALEACDGVGFTILSRPGDIRLLLIDEGAGETGLAHAADAVASALGANCYTTDGSTLGEVVVREAITLGTTICTAESCTGGMVAAALTSVAGSSTAFLGGVVSYGNESKSGLLGVPEDLIAQHGAVSEQVALAMAAGARERFSADLAVSVTGIAGPDGGTAEKPVGLVWFAVASENGTRAVEKRYPGGSREGVRLRAAATALDLLRREMRPL